MFILFCRFVYPQDKDKISVQQLRELFYHHHDCQATEYDIESICETFMAAFENNIYTYMLGESPT